MADERTPAIAVATRGMVKADVTVRTAERDLHSGLYGGAVMNAAHVLLAMLAEVAPDAEGRVRPELAAGVIAPTEAERESWQRLPPGAEALAAVGAAEVAPGAAQELYERVGALPAMDVNLLAGGEPRTIVPAEARGFVSLRLAPGQRAEEMAGVMEGLLRAAAPARAQVEIEWELADPSLFDPRRPRARAGRRGAGAGLRRGPGADAPGRHAAAARGAGRPRHPHHRQRLRARRRRHPRSQRELPAREPAPGRAGRGASCTGRLAGLRDAPA